MDNPEKPEGQSRMDNPETKRRQTSKRNTTV